MVQSLMKKKGKGFEEMSCPDSDGKTIYARQMTILGDGPDKVLVPSILQE